MLVFGLGFLIETLVVLLLLLLEATGFSSSISIVPERVGAGGSGKAGANSLGVRFDDCCEGTSGGGDKRGRLDSGGQVVLTSPSRLGGGWENAYG